MFNLEVEEICIKVREFCIEVKEPCIEVEEFCIQVEELCIEFKGLCIEVEELCFEVKEFCIEIEELCIVVKEFCIQGKKLFIRTIPEISKPWYRLRGIPFRHQPTRNFRLKVRDLQSRNLFRIEETGAEFCEGVDEREHICAGFRDSEPSNMLIPLPDCIANTYQNLNSVRPHGGSSPICILINVADAKAILYLKR